MVLLTLHSSVFKHQGVALVLKAERFHHLEFVGTCEGGYWSLLTFVLFTLECCVYSQILFYHFFIPFYDNYLFNF